MKLSKFTPTLRSLAAQALVVIAPKIIDLARKKLADKKTPKA